MEVHFQTESGVIACGQPVHVLGEAVLGPLRISCDGSIEGQIWGAGAALGCHLQNCGLLERPSVVEVGSGTGIAGLSAAVSGASRVMLSDLPSALGRLQQQIDNNAHAISGADVSAHALEWGDTIAAHELLPEGADLVLAADVLYSGETDVHEALRNTLIALAKPCDALIYHAYEERWPKVVQMWRDGLSEAGLLVERELVLNAPWMVPDGEYSGFRERRVILQVLRLTESCLYS